MYLSFLLLTRILQSLCNATQFSEQINVMDSKELGSASHEKQYKKNTKNLSTKNLYKGYCFCQTEVMISL
jgi:hypothetical protein